MAPMKQIPIALADAWTEYQVELASRFGNRLPVATEAYFDLRDTMVEYITDHVGLGMEDKTVGEVDELFFGDKYPQSLTVLALWVRRNIDEWRRTVS